MQKKFFLITGLCLILLLTAGQVALAATMYSPGYRVKSTLDQNNIGYDSVTATVYLPQTNDIQGVGATGAAYNYLGLETADGHSIEIGLTKDQYDLPEQRWSVCSLANYTGAFANYGADDKWHNFRISQWDPNEPNLVFPDGSQVTMTLKVANNDEAVFQIGNYAPVVLKVPGARVDGYKQIFRRVTSLMTEDQSGFSKHNRWQDVQISKPDGSAETWLPDPGQSFKSNNMDNNDPDGSWVSVSTTAGYPQNIDISMGAAVKNAAEFQVGNPTYYVNDQAQTSDAAPFIASGRTFVPLRYLGYALGLSDQDINWDQTAQTITLTTADTTEVFTVGSQTRRVNGTADTMDTAPVLQDGRVYLPARYVAEPLTDYVDWDQTNGVIFIFPIGQEHPVNPFPANPQSAGTL